MTDEITSSGLTITELYRRLNDRGVSIDRSYLSKIKSGSKPPPSEEITRAIANELGCDSEPLIIASYLSKAPPEFISAFNRLDDLINDVLVYIQKNCNHKQLQQLMDLLISDNLQYKMLDKSFFNLINKGALINSDYINNVISYCRETSNMKQKLCIINTLIKFTTGTIFGLKLPQSTFTPQNIDVSLNPFSKEELSIDEIDYLKESLELYRKQKINWNK